MPRKLIEGESWEERIKRLKRTKTVAQFNNIHQLLREILDKQIAIAVRVDKLNENHLIYQKDKELVRKIKKAEEVLRLSAVELKRILSISSTGTKD